MTAAGRLIRLAVNPWIGFFLLVLAAWGWLFMLSAEVGRATSITALGPGMSWFAPLMETLGAFGAHFGHAAHAGLAATVGMWCLMSVAMMAPTAVPVLRTYRDMVEGSGGRTPRAGFHAFIAGYLTVWALFSVGAGAAQYVLAAAGLVSAAGVSTVPWLTIGLLVVAGAYQFSTLKQACLRRCRSPMAFFLSHWRAGVRGALAMGLHHGAICLGCCWALMALAFVGGSMNLAWMGGAMLLMIVEKLPVGRWLTAPLGGVLLVAAGIFATSSLLAP